MARFSVLVKMITRIQKQMQGTANHFSSILLRISIVIKVVFTRVIKCLENVTCVRLNQN